MMQSRSVQKYDYNRMIDRQEFLAIDNASEKYRHRHTTKLGLMVEPP
jgi:hypothetical protein